MIFSECQAREGTVLSRAICFSVSWPLGSRAGLVPFPVTRSVLFPEPGDTGLVNDDTNTHQSPDHVESSSEQRAGRGVPSDEQISKQSQPAKYNCL